jgi:hypothetical protein
MPRWIPGAPRLHASRQQSPVRDQVRGALGETLVSSGECLGRVVTRSWADLVRHVARARLSLLDTRRAVGRLSTELTRPQEVERREP